MTDEQNSNMISDESQLAYEFVERDEQTEPTAEIDYDNLIHIQSKTREFEEGEEEQAKNIVFYCKDCGELCETDKKKGKKLKFICQNCKGEKIYFGSELAIRGFFHLKS